MKVKESSATQRRISARSSQRQRGQNDRRQDRPGASEAAAALRPTSVGEHNSKSTSVPTLGEEFQLVRI